MHRLIKLSTHDSSRLEYLLLLNYLLTIIVFLSDYGYIFFHLLFFIKSKLSLFSISCLTLKRVIIRAPHRGIEILHWFKENCARIRSVSGLSADTQDFWYRIGSEKWQCCIPNNNNQSIHIEHTSVSTSESASSSSSCSWSIMQSESSSSSALCGLGLTSGTFVLLFTESTWFTDLSVWLFERTFPLCFLKEKQSTCKLFWGNATYSQTLSDYSTSEPCSSEQRKDLRKKQGWILMRCISRKCIKNITWCLAYLLLRSSFWASLSDHATGHR